MSEKEAKQNEGSLVLNEKLSIEETSKEQDDVCSTENVPEEEENLKDKEETLTDLGDIEDSDEEDEADALTTAIDKHTEYFVSAYISKIHPVTQMRGNPRIPIELWSNYKAVMDGGNYVTNNSSENWNSVSKLTLPLKPSIWAVLMALKMEEQHAKTRFHGSLGDDDEEEDNTKRVRDRVDRFKKLTAILMMYREIPIKDYLDALMAMYNNIRVDN